MTLSELQTYQLVCNGCQKVLIFHGHHRFEVDAQIPPDWIVVDRWDGVYHYCPECQMEELL